MKSKIIIMLTHNDRTVKNAQEVFDSCKMAKLVASMKAAGKTTFLEVVTYSEEDCMAGAKVAVEMGFDYLMGTLFFDSVYAYLQKHQVKYLPFCGKVSGSPSVLEGSFDEIIADARSMLAKGVYGIDLLAFRHAQGAELAEAYCAAVDAPVVIAGSINSNERIDFINRVDPWAFTMGSALFTENFAPGQGFRKNLEAVAAYMDSIQ